MSSKLLMATNNRGKVVELRQLLTGIPVEIFTLADYPELAPVEETGQTFLENALLKARSGAEATGLITVADDSGLEVDVLGGEPGVRSARFAGENANDESNNTKLLALLEDVPEEQRTARFVSVIAIATPEGKSYSFRGECEGVILRKAQGGGGFGYDPLFYYQPLAKTFAELSVEEKNKISHRGKALREASSSLRQLL